MSRKVVLGALTLILFAALTLHTNAYGQGFRVSNGYYGQSYYGQGNVYGQRHYANYGQGFNGYAPGAYSGYGNGGYGYNSGYAPQFRTYGGNGFGNQVYYNGYGNSGYYQQRYAPAYSSPYGYRVYNSYGGNGW